MGSLARKIAMAFAKNTLTQYFGCFIISMIPLIELRGAIPIAYVFKGLNPENFNIVWGYVIIALGNMLPVPIIFFFARRCLNGARISRSSESSSPSVLRRDIREERSFRLRQDADCLWLCSFLWEYLFPEQVHGPELSLHRFLI